MCPFLQSLHWLQTCQMKVGGTLWGLHCKRPLIKVRRTIAHNFLQLKSVKLTLKKHKHSSWGKTIPVGTDNTTVVSYINKEGAMRAGSLWSFLWRLLSWCNLRQIVLRARHILRHLNVIVNKLSRHKQVIQSEWSLLQEVFNHLCARWDTPPVDRCVSRFNHKLPKVVYPVFNHKTWKVDALSLH